MAGSVDSVNVATAAAIALHELASTPARRDRAARLRHACLGGLAGAAAVGALGALIARRG